MLEAGGTAAAAEVVRKAAVKLRSDAGEFESGRAGLFRARVGVFSRRRRRALFNLALLFPLLYSLAALSSEALKNSTSTFVQVNIIFNSGQEFVVTGTNTLRGPDLFAVNQTTQGGAQLFAHIATYTDAETTLPRGGITVYYNALHGWSLAQTFSKAQALAKLIKSIKHVPYAAADNRFPRSADAVGKPVARAGAGSK